jgi:hypothetical protein
MPVLGTLGGASQFGFGRSAKITIQRPVITLDTGYSGSSSFTLTRPRFTSSAFIFSNGVPSTAHGSSDWQFSTSSDFSSTISPQTISSSTTNKTSYTISTKFSYSTLIYARVRYRDNASPANVSDWSVPISFTTQSQPSITTPSIISPTQNAFLSDSRTISIFTSDFSIANDEDGETHLSTTYQVSDVSDFSTTVYNTTSTTSKTTITTSDVGAGTKYIRVKHNGSLGIATSNWSSTRTISIAFADIGSGISTFYPDSTTFVVTSSKSTTLQSGTYRISLYGGGGGAANGGSNGSRRGGYAGCVVKDVYLSAPTSLSFTIATGGGGASGNAENNTAFPGSGGSPGGGSGGGGSNDRWCGGGGGGYSAATISGSTIYAAGGGGAAGDSVSEGRSANRGTGTEWYGPSGVFKLVRKGTGAGGKTVESQDGSSGSSGWGGGGGSSSFRARDYTEQIYNEPAGFPSNGTGYYATIGGTRYDAASTGSYHYTNNRGDRNEDVRMKIYNYKEGGNSGTEVTPVMYISDDTLKRIQMTDLIPANSDGPYGSTAPSWGLTAKIGYFYNESKLRGNVNRDDNMDLDQYKYYWNSSFLAGDGGSNAGSFGRSYAEDYGVANGYYYNYGQYTFGDAGTDSNGWNGKSGGAVIKLISAQNPPSVSITSHPSSVNTTAGSWFTLSVSATDTANTSDNTSITYQWQLSTNSGGSWSDISGATSSQLKRYDRCYYSDNGNWVRCVVTASNGRGSSTATSNVAIITINRAYPDRVNPVLPFASSYGTDANISAFERAITQDNTDWVAYADEYSIKSAPYTQGANIDIGTGKVRIKWNSELRFWKDDGRSGTGCSNGQGLYWDVAARVSILRLRGNFAFDWVHYWDSHERSHRLDESMTRSSSNYKTSNWDFDDTIDLDPDYYYKICIQFRTNNTHICQCSGGSYINCNSTSDQGNWRFRAMSPAYYSQTAAYYQFDTRPNLDGYLRG